MLPNQRGQRSLKLQGTGLLRMRDPPPELDLAAAAFAPPAPPPLPGHVSALLKPQLPLNLATLLLSKVSCKPNQDKPNKCNHHHEQVIQLLFLLVCFWQWGEGGAVRVLHITKHLLIYLKSQLAKG